MESLVTTREQSWLAWFLRGILLLGFIFLLGRLAELQIIKGNYFRGLADENRIKRITIPAARGKVLARGGEVLEGDTFAHVAGYIGRVNVEEAGKVDPECPDKGIRKPDSLVGRSGLEAFYDCTLRGIDGEKLVEVDTKGREVRTIGVKNPIAGADIITNIDYQLQKKIPEIIDKAKDLPVSPKGAVVVTDTKGEVLALYSFPSFDPEKAAA